MAKSSMVDADTGGPVTKNTVNAVSRDEYSRRLLQGPALRELAKRDQYLRSNENEERSLDEKIWAEFPSPGEPKTWPERAPTLTTFGPNPGALRFYNRYGAADGLNSPENIMAQINELRKNPDEQSQLRLRILQDALSHIYGINNGR